MNWTAMPTTGEPHDARQSNHERKGKTVLLMLGIHASPRDGLAACSRPIPLSCGTALL